MPEPSYLSSRRTSHSYSPSISLRTECRSTASSNHNSSFLSDSSQNIPYLNGSKFDTRLNSLGPSIAPDSKSFLRVRKFEVFSPSHKTQKVSNTQKSSEKLNDPVLLGYRLLNNTDTFTVNGNNIWSNQNYSNQYFDRESPKSTRSDQSSISDDGNAKQSSFTAINEDLNHLQISKYDTDYHNSSGNSESVNNFTIIKAPSSYCDYFETSSNSSNSSSPLQIHKSANMENSKGQGSSKLWSSQDNLKRIHPAGLQNLGNTCFMNTILQCLGHTQPLLDYCLSKSFAVDINRTTSNMKGALITSFANLMQLMWKNDNTSVSPTTFKGQIQRFSPRFTGYSQQDAQEFLHYLLQGLHCDVNRVKTKQSALQDDIDDRLNDNDKAIESWKRYLRFDNSRIVDIFVGQLKSTLKCTSCKYTSVTFDPFWDISLPIPKTSGRATLQECLSLFTREEVLDGDEKPVCSNCKARRKCIKSFKIHKFPWILILHLKRFSQNRSFREKLHTPVDFPLNGLDLAPYATESNRGRSASYNLYGVSHHSGSTSSGHYTASCCHPITHQWFRYNDESVNEIRPAEVMNSEAYVLFFELSSQSSRL